MKLNQFRGLFPVLALIAGTVVAQDLDKIYTPEYFGLSIGMPDQDMLNSLATQGFTFQPGGQ
jgi:hypothetical protein